MLAIVQGLFHGCKFFKHYLLLDRKSTVELEALISVLSRNKINKLNSRRLTRWKERLLIYDFEIEHCKSQRMGITDQLSRNPQQDPLPENKVFESFIINFLTHMNSSKNNILIDTYSKQIQAKRVLIEAIERTKMTEKKQTNKSHDVMTILLHKAIGRKTNIIPIEHTKTSIETINLLSAFCLNSNYNSVA